ncbi:hypothetical protein F183_A11290 [Bryobacterales bacterium F-183]|nr:hypothetical protein F183_A11290 [Bryobacterales bacterium F-183]
MKSLGFNWKADRISGSVVRLPLLFGLAMASMAVGRADVILDSVGTPASYVPANGWSILSVDSPFIYSAYGVEFSSSIKRKLTKFEFGIGVAGNSSGGFVAKLWSSNNGKVGTQLASWSITPTTIFGSCCDLLQLETPNGPELAAGAFYFVTLQGTGPFSLGAWNYAQGMGTLAYSADGGLGWQSSVNRLPALRIHASALPTAVPEASSVALLALSLLTAQGASRWRRVHGRKL